ncbi:MAG: CsbD family protein [Candidatus Binatia bacterium]
MSGAMDKAKGRIKEAAGALTGDKKLKREGQVDQAAGDVKDATEKVIDKVKKAVNGR